MKSTYFFLGPRCPVDEMAEQSLSVKRLNNALLSYPQQRNIG